MKYFLPLLTIYSLLLTNLAFASSGGGGIQADKINPSVSGNPVQIPNVQVDNINIDGNTVKSTSSDIIIDSANKIKPNKDIEPNTTGINIGSSSTSFNDIYANGQHYGLRIENVLSSSMPASSSASKGRVVYATDTKKFYIDDGSSFILASGSGGGISAWVTATTYEVDSIIHINNKIYKCIIAHTSGTFATDLSSGDWIELAADPSSEILTGYSAGAGTVGSTDSVKSAIQKIDGNVSSLSSSTTTNLATKIDKSTVTAKGDIIVATASSTPSKISVGTDGQVITADSTQGTGVKYADPTIKVKSDTGTSTSTKTITVPDGSIVTDSASGYILNLSNSLAIDSSFESSDPVTNAGWVITNAGTVAVNTTYHDDRKQSLYVPASVSGTGATAVLDVTTNAAGLKGQQGIVAISVRRDNVAPTASVTVCSRVDGVTGSGSSSCAIVPVYDANNPFKRIIIPVVMGGTSTGISIKATGFEGYYLDSLYIGAGLPLQNVSGAKLFGTLKYSGIAGCSWTYSASTTYNDASANATCNSPVVTGQLLASSTKTASFDLPAGSPAGTYFIIANAMIYQSTSTGKVSYRITDGTLSGDDNTSYLLNQSLGVITSSLTFSSSINSRTTIKIQAKSENTAVPAIYADLQALTFSVYYYPPDSKIYSQTQDTVEAIESLATSSTFGSTNTGVPVLTITKNTNLGIIQVDSTSAAGTSFKALKDCTFTISTSSITTSASSVYITKNATILTVATPDGVMANAGLNGSALTATITLKANDVVRLQRNSTNTTNFSNITITATTITPAIVGSFAEVTTSPGLNNNILFSGQISNAAVLSNQKGGIVSSCTFSSTGVLDCTVPSGKLSSTPNCSASCNEGNSASQFACYFNIGGTTSTNIQFKTTTSAGSTLSNRGVSYICHGEKP